MDALPAGLKACRAAAPRRGQRGVAALEFALVTTLFLVVLFGILSYGALFLVQQALARAAEEGARAVMQANYELPAGASLSQDMACDPARQSVKWLNSHREMLGQGPVDCELSAPVNCAYEAGLRCVSLIVTYKNYRNYPLIPELLPLGAWLESLFGNGTAWIPQHLSALATVQLGKDVAPGT